MNRKLRCPRDPHSAVGVLQMFPGETRYELADELYDVEADPGETKNVLVAVGAPTT